MPTPISISSLPRANVGVPAAGTVQLVKATPIERVWPLTSSPSSAHDFRSSAFFRRGADDLFDHQRAGDAAAAGAVGRFLDGDVVVGHDVATSRRHFRCHVEIHAIAGVVLDDEEHAGLPPTAAAASTI